MNQCSFHGRLTRDPELKTSQSGKEFTSFTIAINRISKKDDGQQVTDFIPITAFDQTAAFICKYFHKGDGIIVTGPLQSNSRTDSEGKKATFYNVVARNVEFAEKKYEGGSNSTVNPADDEELPF